MRIPISFDEVPYFNNEYRGDLIVTHGVLYYFPHTRVAASRHAPEIGGKETIELLNIAGLIVPLVGIAPWLHTFADKSIKAGKLLNRTIRPSTNSPRIKSAGLWDHNQTSHELQKILDGHIELRRHEAPSFQDDAVPKPMRFEASETQDLKFGLKLKFAARYDIHDFRISPLHRSLLRGSLLEGGFIS